VTRFDVVRTGASAPNSQPATQKNVSHRKGPANPSAAALQQQFSSAIKRVEVIWGETVVYVDPSSAKQVIRWLHDDQSQQYDFLSDVTAVEYRDAEVPMEVVWHLRSLPFRRFLRIKAQIPKGAATSTAQQIGWSASATTCSGFASTGIPICVDC